MSCGHYHFVETALLEETDRGSFRITTTDHETWITRLVPLDQDRESHGLAAIWLRCLCCGTIAYTDGTDELRERIPASRDPADRGHEHCPEATSPASGQPDA